MKRFFAILLCVFILTFNTISVKAMDIGVAIEVGQEVFYAGWDQVMALINGVVIPTSQYAGAADKTVAMAAFYDDWLGTLSGLTQYWGGDIAESETGAISINYPLDYGMSGRYANNFLTEYANLTQDINNGFAVPLNGNVLAAWNRYNNLWIQRYINGFEPKDTINVYPDPDYATYIDNINGDGFFFKAWNYTTLYPQYTNINLSLTPAYNYSWLVFPESGIQNSTIQSNNNSSFWSSNTCEKTSVYITSLQNGEFYYRYTGICPSNFSYYGNTYNSALYRVVGGSDYVQANFTNIGTYTYQSGNFSTLASCFSDLAKHAKNVDIYVDGVLWSYTGYQKEPQILAPDVIRNESGQIIGNDVYVPEQDLMIDLIGWQNLVDDKILSGEDITFDDLIDAGVITDADGNIIDNNDLDSYFKKKSISGVIDDALEDTQAIALVPDLPVPPDPGDTDPFNWNFPEFIPDIPDANFAPRQTGLSVLARIINVTNQSLPGELIAMFWGIVITLVILGIIKIAHK